ncbi:MAG: error-prone DNA polymerase, partial [Burkholderiales bacterium]|nr:error-prone DNA polymerase [Burkholderiales bacterium]
SQPEELVERAHKQGYRALALTDECSVAGVVRAHVAAKKIGLKLLIGSQFSVAVPESAGGDAPGPFSFGVLACNLNGYGNLCEFITKLRRASEKGTYHLDLGDIASDELADCVVVASPVRGSTDAQLVGLARWLLTHFTGRCWLGVELLRQLDDEMWLHKLRGASELSAIPLVAVGDVYMHVRSRKALHDVMTAIRTGRPLTECGRELQVNAERHLRTRLRLAQTFPADLLAETLQVAERCSFSLDELKYQYPDEVVPAGETPSSYLRRITYEGAGRRWPEGVPAKVEAQIEHELQLIGDLHYEHYFLTVYDIVAFARSRQILCQGRGSAANSVVCYCLGVTEVDPARMSVLFERFISKERNEPPDIDVDFEHERREEVIQYVFARYGRHRAAITAVASTYHGAGAVRDVARVLGLPPDQVDALARCFGHWNDALPPAAQLREQGFDPDSPLLHRVLVLTAELIGFPRHLSQHPGGFVISEQPLHELVPVENASMEGRTVVQWDKDDLDAVGLLKVDILALGMLSALRRCLELVGHHHGRALTLATIPPEDPDTYAMIGRADTVGVFQIESRAQMAMLPRLQPRNFYDLVIEVAIVRPGPIQGDMVHPYLRRRDGIEPVEFPTRELEDVLRPTLGVPLFQEQAMKIAIVAAGFSPSEADRLRRAMATFRRLGTIHAFEEKFVSGMVARGYERTFAERCFHQIEGFGDYGFPMSHAASFALLVYVSAWLKHHYPEVFCAAILNAQPMGFYAPAQLVRDAQNHGVEVRAPDVNASDGDHTLEKAEGGRCALRLGFRQIKGFREEDAAALVAARGAGYDGVRHLAGVAALSSEALTLLADADAFRALGLDRRQALWAVKGLDGGAQSARAPTPELPLFQFADPERLRPEEEVALPAMRLGEHIVCDYATLHLSLKAHPLSLLRGLLAARRVVPHGELGRVADGARVRVAGLALVRQRPGTAHGVTFATLEDETGIANVIVWADVFEHFRRPFLASRLMLV